MTSRVIVHSGDERKATSGETCSGSNLSTSGPKRARVMRVAAPGATPVYGMLVLAPPSRTAGRTGGEAGRPPKGIRAHPTDELVSIDFKGNPHSSILDSAYTKVMDGDFVKALSWYDNEWGYSCRCVDLLRLIEKKGL